MQAIKEGTMHKLLPAVAMALIALGACSGDRNREVAMSGGVSRSVEAGRAASSRDLVPISEAESAERPRAEPARERPRREGRARTARPAPSPAPAPVSTSAPEPAAAPPSAPPTAPNSDTIESPPPEDPTAARSDSTAAAGSDSSITPAPAPAPAPAPDTLAARPPDSAPAEPAGGSARGTLASGTRFSVALDDSIDSRHDSAGRAVTAKVMEAVTDSRGRTVIPAGAPVRLTVTRLEPARSRDAADGKLEFRVDGVELGGRLRRVSADVQAVPHELRGRGVTGGDAAKVGAGAAAGAVLGRVVGGNTKGAVIGGVVGAAGGAAVASQTASRDVVVKARTPIVLVLSAPLTAAAR